jgi:hypothetical protein
VPESSFAQGGNGRTSALSGPVRAVASGMGGARRAPVGPHALPSTERPGTLHRRWSSASGAIVALTFTLRLRRDGQERGAGAESSSEDHKSVLAQDLEAIQ